MLIPYNTDAPLYHWPYATIGLIATNVLCFIGVSIVCGRPVFIDLAEVDMFCLQYGVINPLQWVTSIFIHTGPLHLLCNILFLFPFGLIVEGKIGWWRFLLVYLFIGILQSAVEQLLMLYLGLQGGSVGASSAIAGIMAIAVVWAPKNHILCWFVMRYVGALQWEVPVFIFGGGYILFDLAICGIGLAVNGDIGSSFLHLMGVVVGLGIGSLLLVTKRVDCEGYDVMSLMTGKEGIGSPTRAQTKELEKRHAEERAQREFELRDAKEKIAMYLASDQISMAVARFDALKKTYPQVNWSRENLAKVIKGFETNGNHEQCRHFMQQYISMFPHDPLGTKLKAKLAQFYIVNNGRPRKGLSMLAGIDQSRFDQKQIELLKKLIINAKRQIADGIIEMED